MEAEAATGKGPGTGEVWDGSGWGEAGGADGGGGGGAASAEESELDDVIIVWIPLVPQRRAGEMR